jgi:PIN domain nuclease of toxin-antitoxin system
VKLLLDTSTFLWYIAADARLPEPVVAAIRSNENDVSLSSVSFWEIIIKHQLGRLPLAESPSSYVPRQREHHKIESLPLEESAIRHLAKLPRHHRDQFDRMLICQSIEHDLSLVTSDSAILDYPVKIFWG